MEKRERTKNQKNLIFGIFMLVLFVVWTVLVKMVDVEPIGPNGSSVGFATLNGFVHELLGVHMALYDITDWLSIIPLLFIFAFAVLGVVQLVKRKSIFKVDNSILILGGFYAVVMAVFVLFEKGLARVEWRKWMKTVLSFTGANGFGAYLVHGLVNEYAVALVGKGRLAAHPALWIPVTTVLVAAVSFCLAALIRKLPKIGRWVS